MNLSAQSSNLELAHKMAGLSAFCAANAFPEMIIGDGKTTSDFVKKVSDSFISVPNELNPSFFKIFELDAKIPDDW